MGYLKLVWTITFRSNEGQYFYGQTLQQEETSNECKCNNTHVFICLS